jgi:PleD family two-component response regulator
MKAAETTPDLIITEMLMPRMDGFELRRKLRASDF